MYLLGFDIGSSSVKASLIDAETGEAIASGSSPKTEMKIEAPQPGWAEQSPLDWWEHLKNALNEIKTKSKADLKEVKAIGISYQMHGLVCVDKNLEVLRPSIIWCDSRAVEIGKKALENIGEKKALKHLLNSPGNFTASKLKWVKNNQKDIYSKIYKFMLPGDYIAMKLSGIPQTTVSGLSEGIFWDFKEDKIADLVLDEYGIDKSLIPSVVDTFSTQAEVSESAAKELGLKVGTKISYRAGDQPNNAFSLNVLEEGEVAATAGTSGVVYGITEDAAYDKRSRVNSFVHVNHTDKDPRYGVLLCINGTGILNSWLKNTLFQGKLDYVKINELASSVAPGADGLSIYPFGNGAERVLENDEPGATMRGINFNRHGAGHVARAAQEGITFGLAYGMEVMNHMGIKTKTVRAGEANMFLSPIFREAFCNTTGAVVELYNTDGAQGAARGAGVGAGIYKNFKEAFNNFKKLAVIEPDNEKSKIYTELYENWKENL